MAPVQSPIDRNELVKHLDGVRRLARSLVLDDAEADDVMQDAAVAALESGRAPRKGLAAWLSGVTRNVVRNRRRGESRRRKRETDAARPEATPSAAESVVRAAEQSRLLEHVVNLEEPYRTAVVLRFVEGLPPRVMATRLGQPVETVRTHVKRGLTRLRAELDQRHGGRDMWRASLLLVADDAPYRPAASGGLAGGKKAVVALAAVAAITLAAWWIWSLAQDASTDAQPPIELAGDASMRTDAAPEEDPDRKPIVVEDTGRERPPLEGRPEEPPTEVKAPDLPELPDAAPSESPRERVVPVRPEPVVRPPELGPKPKGEGVAGRLLADQTGGRVSLPAARVWIGSPQRWVDGIASSLRGRVRPGLIYEAPRHQRDVDAFEIDLYEVTNAQYQRFLHLEAEGRWRVERRVTGTLDEIARAIVVRDVPENLDWEQTARQLYMANFDVLNDRHRAAVVRRAGTVDFERTFQRMREIQIRTGTELLFYDRAPPASWPDMRPAAGRAAHPVRGVSYEEAEAFAGWAGKHIPTEFEWEYACRGANGSPYPWGGRPTRFNTRVNGGATFPRGEGPDTAVMDAFPDGRSPFGLFHTLGNVSEWTSSFLEPYPGSADVLMPQWAELVIRGGSAADTERLYVRPAYRGRPAAGFDDEGAPLERLAAHANRRFAWTGFRTAVYPEPGKSRVRSMQRVLQANEVLPASALEIDGFAAAEVRELIPPGTTIENGIFVNQRAWSFVVAPLKRPAIQAFDAPPSYTIDEPHGIDDTAQLLREAADPNALLLGQLLTDTRLEGLYAVRGLSASRKPTKLLPAEAPPGRYLIGLQYDRIVLLTPNLRYAWYVTPRPITRATASVLRRRAPARGRPEGRAVLNLDVSGALLSIELTVPLGDGKLSDRAVRLRFRLTADARVVHNVGPWRTHRGR
ncbi:MAG: sigma-70 family RNA polymerase sigma factor [Planctomycetota bacterium]|nr:sigma-70 family RNA polymerase sigma factor [Planctomycetota bacterium]